jgi:hypothetical protein
MAGKSGYDTANQQFKQNRIETGRQRAAQAMAAGDHRSALAMLLQGGDIQGATTVGSLINQEASRGLAERTLTNTTRHQGVMEGIARQGLEGGKTPAGFMPGEGGALVPRTGGPADLKYIEATAEARVKPRQFSVGDITKLDEEGKKFANLTRFKDTFEPRFAGYKASVIGNIANLAGRNLPADVVGPDIEQGSAWWQDYQASKNIVRNELFGSALTKTEQSEYEKADVNPGMEPKQIQINLQRQQEIVQAGLKRKANALIVSGYDPAAISAAYGVDVKELGVIDKGKKGGTAAPQENPQAGGVPPQAAIDFLRKNPRAAAAFDAKYGVGSAMKALGNE